MVFLISKSYPLSLLNYVHYLGNTNGFSPLNDLPGWAVKHFTGEGEQEHKIDCNGDDDVEIFSVELA